MIRRLFWDFDGTLYNSYPEVLRSFQKAADDMHLGGLMTTEEQRRLLKVSVFHAASECARRGQADVNRLMAAFARYHAADMNFEGYPGLAQCLQSLHDAGCSHYLYTHRDHAAVDKLKQDGLWRLFADTVLRTDGFPDKPAPDALLAMMARNGLSAAECVMIGDRPIDVQAGWNAGMKGILFDPEGYYDDFQVDRRCKSLPELTEMLLNQ